MFGAILFKALSFDTISTPAWKSIHWINSLSVYMYRTENGKKKWRKGGRLSVLIWEIEMSMPWSKLIFLCDFQKFPPSKLFGRSARNFAAFKICRPKHLHFICIMLNAPPYAIILRHNLNGHFHVKERSRSRCNGSRTKKQRVNEIAAKRLQISEDKSRTK